MSATPSDERERQVPPPSTVVRTATWRTPVVILLCGCLIALVGFGARSGLGFFLAPIIYPLEILPERYHFYLYLWPPTPVIEFSRAVLVGGTWPTLTGNLLLVLDASALLLAGALVFRRLGPRAAEYL